MNYVETVVGAVAPGEPAVVLPYEHFLHFLGDRRQSAPSLDAEVLSPPAGYVEPFESRQRRILEDVRGQPGIRMCRPDSRFPVPDGLAHVPGARRARIGYQPVHSR